MSKYLSESSSKPGEMSEYLLDLNTGEIVAEATLPWEQPIGGKVFLTADGPIELSGASVNFLGFCKSEKNFYLLIESEESPCIISSALESSHLIRVVSYSELLAEAVADICQKYDSYYSLSNPSPLEELDPELLIQVGLLKNSFYFRNWTGLDYFGTVYYPFENRQFISEALTMARKLIRSKN